MNIERYKWPVIVAASLHGALLLITPDSTRIVRDPPVKADPNRPPPVVEITVPDQEDPPAGEAGGGASPLPSLPEVPVLADLRDLVIPTVDRAVPDKPVTDLRIPSVGPVGPEVGPGTLGSPNIARLANLDRVPRAMVQSSPEYPYSLRQAGVNGSVTVEFVVGIDGHVASAEATRWTHREFVDSAVRAVLRWKFEPGTINGRKVRFRMAVPIEFNAAS